MNDTYNAITLDDIRQLIEKQLAELVDASEHCHFTNEIAEINQAICLSTQTLLLLKNQCGGAASVDVPFRPTSEEN